MARKIGLAPPVGLVACRLLFTGCGTEGSPAQKTSDQRAGEQAADSVSQRSNEKPGWDRSGWLQDFAQVLGMTVDGVRTRMQKGKSLAELIEERGLNAVESGRMTRQQADKFLADLERRGLNAWDWSGLNRQEQRQSPSSLFRL
ncbi:MAG: hypothetical protein H5T92_04345 [Synergistales bacterium]|nr:hypothetical protein [Synergistales bacterium]